MHLGPPHRSALRLFLSLAVAAAVIVATPMAWSQDDAPADAMGDAPDSLELTDIADDAVMADPLMLDSIMPNIVVHRSEPRVFLFGTGFAIGTQAFVGLVQLEDPFYASPESMNWTVPA